MAQLLNHISKLINVAGKPSQYSTDEDIGLSSRPAIYQLRGVLSPPLSRPRECADEAGGAFPGNAGRCAVTGASSLAYEVAPALAIERINHAVEELVDADRVEHRGPAGSVERDWEAVVSEDDGEQVPPGINPEERSGAAGLPEGPGCQPHSPA